jgi:hypothetical protein
VFYAVSHERCRSWHDYGDGDRIRIEIKDIREIFSYAIIRSPAVGISADFVMLLSIAIDAEYEINLVLTAEIEKLPINESAVCRHPELDPASKTAPGTGYYPPDRTEFEEWLATKEGYNANVVGLTGQEIHRLIRRVERHGPVYLLTRVAVGASEIAVVGEAKSRVFDV